MSENNDAPAPTPEPSNWQEWNESKNAYQGETLSADTENRINIPYAEKRIETPSAPCPCKVTSSGYVYKLHQPNCPNNKGETPSALSAADLQPLKDACDRDWKDETPAQIVTIAANAIYWRDKEIADLREKLSTAERERDHWKRALKEFTPEDIRGMAWDTNALLDQKLKAVEAELARVLSALVKWGTLVGDNKHMSVANFLAALRTGGEPK